MHTCSKCRVKITEDEIGAFGNKNTCYCAPCTEESSKQVKDMTASYVNKYGTKPGRYMTRYISTVCWGFDPA